MGRLDSLRNRSGDPLVSIVIPTLNSAATIGATLNSIVKQKYKNLEVIVVDSNSTDGTRTIAGSFHKTQVFVHSQGRSAQVNFGVSKAAGTYVYRVDSDFVLEPGVVVEAVRACEAGATGVVIHNTSDPTISVWSRARKLERDCYRDEYWHVAVRFMRKSDFETVGGFLEFLIAAEDYDLHNRLLKRGIRLARIRAEEVHIGEPRHLKDVVTKHLYYGKEVGKFIKTNPEVSWRQLTPFRPAFIRHWRDFLKDPTATFAFFIYEYVRYVAALVGYLSKTAGARP